jgi:hypothetical protein
MFQIPRAVRRSEFRSPRRDRRMPLLAAVTAAALVALSAQGAAVASADELGDAASSASSASTASSVSSPLEAQAADATEAVEAAGVAQAGAGNADEASTPPAEAAEAPSGAPAGQAAEAPDPTDVGAADPAEAADPTQAAEAAEAADPTQATEAPGPSDDPGAGAPASGTPVSAAGAADPTQATEAPGPSDVPGAVGLADPVALVNTPPVGVADHYTVAVDTVLNVAAPGVLGNDFDAEGDFLFTSQGTTGTAQGGHVSTIWDRSIIYTPAPGFVGTDSWTYWPQDPFAQSASATSVTFTVVDTTDAAPVAHDDSYETPAGTSLVVSGAGVLGNDTDSDGNALAVVSALAGAGAIASANGGTVDWLSTGGFTYLPAPGFIGYDTVTYWITDGVLEGNLATVTIKVGDWTNLPPVAQDDQYATAVNHVLTVDAQHGLLANDSDATDQISVVVPFMLDTGRASVDLHSDGSFSYSSHYYDTVGPDTFTYQVTDGSYNLPVTATVTIDVAPFANGAPIAVDDHYTTPKNTGLGVGAATGLLANDSDPDQDAISIQFAQIDAPTEAGGIVNVGLNGSFSYTPPAGFVGVDGFSYNIVDVFGGQAIAIAFVTVTDPDAVGNTMPVATDDHYSTTPDTTLVVSGANGMLLNDIDADGDPLHSIIPALPYGSASVEGGTVTGTPDGGFSYAPPAGFVGEDEFVYHVLDGSVESFDIGTVRITVATAVPAVTGGTGETGGTGGTDVAGGPDAGAAGGADATSADHDDPVVASDASGELALTGAMPDGTLALSLLLLLTGAAGIVVAAMAHRRSRRY